jgi:hypothetical protein
MFEFVIHQFKMKINLSEFYNNNNNNNNNIIVLIVIEFS